MMTREELEQALIGINLYEDNKKLFRITKIANIPDKKAVMLSDGCHFRVLPIYTLMSLLIGVRVTRRALDSAGNLTDRMHEYELGVGETINKQE